MFNKFHKRLVLIIAICFLVMAGSGLMRASAGQDAGAMLENWFNGKRSQSVNEIDQAIETEKNRLMGELRTELNQSIGGAAKEIENFTDAEKARRIQALRDYANTLMAGIGQDGADWDKHAYLNDVEKAIQQATHHIDIAADKAKKNAEKNKPKKEKAATEPTSTQPDQQPALENPAESVQPEAPAKEAEKAPEQPAPPAATEPAENTQPAETSQTTAPAPESPPADSSAQDAPSAEESGGE
ncbi:hypothetical protein [Bhargavaea ginsengi]|nr:hypothetical protein [Bhargavaea ginsengi]